MAKTKNGYISRADWLGLVSQGAAILGAEALDRRVLVDRQRSEAGYPSSSRGSIHVTKMAAFLVAKIKSNVQNKRTARERYVDYTESVARKKREKSLVERDIGEIPAPVDPARRERTKNDFIAFCKEYGGEVSFFRDWQTVHYEVASDIQDVILSGGKKAIAAPRGMFKSTFLRWAVLFAMLQHPQRHKTVVYLGAVGGATLRTRKFILAQLRHNKTIQADFPEVCYPIELYNGIKQRRLTYNDVPVEASWSNTEIVFPTLAGYETSGSIVMFLSIGSEGIRGADHTSEAFAIRPSLVVIDDPQSDMSANSVSMVKGMHGIVSRIDFLGSATTTRSSGAGRRDKCCTTSSDCLPCSHHP